MCAKNLWPFKESRPVDAGDVSNKKHNGTKYEVSMTITSKEKVSSLIPLELFIVMLSFYLLIQFSLFVLF